jgi:hypothetical protein
VYVEHAAAELFEEARREQTHVAREADQLDAARAQGLGDLALVLLARAPAPLDDRRLYPALARSFEPRRTRLVADDDDDLRARHAPPGHGVGQRDHVRPATRDEDSDSHKEVDSRQ